MARDVPYAIEQQTTSLVTRPGYLIEVPGIAGFPNLTSRNTQLRWNDKDWLPTLDFSVSGLSWDGSGNQKGRIEFNDSSTYDASNTGTMSNVILFYKLAGQPINIYFFYANLASTTNILTNEEVLSLFSGTIDECEINSNGRVIITITTDFLSSMFSPRRYIRPSDPTLDPNRDVGFNWVPPSGTIITWNNDTYKLERSDS